MSEVSIPIASAKPMLSIDGQDAPELDTALFELVVAERSDGLARAEVAFGNWGTVDGSSGYTLFDRRKLEFGKRLEVRIAGTRVFTGRIMALEGLFPKSGAGNAELLVLAEDKLQDLRMTRRTRSFAQMSDGDVARSLASDHGLRAEINLSGPTHVVLTQVNQSDLAFLRDRARALNAEIWVDDDTLHVAQRPSRNSGAAIALSYGTSLQSFTVRADLAGQRTSLSVSGWSPADKQAVHEEASASVLSSELEGGDGGISILQQVLGARSDSVSHLMPANADEARGIAEAWLRQLGRRFVCGRGTARPEAQLRVGKHVDLGGVGPMFSGLYTLTEVSHRFDVAQGLRSEFAVERPAIGRS